MRRLRAPSAKPPRTLQANWHLDDLEDLSIHHNINLEKEMADIIAREIDRELLEQIRKYK